MLTNLISVIEASLYKKSSKSHVFIYLRRLRLLHPRERICILNLWCTHPSGRRNTFHHLLLHHHGRLIINFENVWSELNVKKRRLYEEKRSEFWELCHLCRLFLRSHGHRHGRLFHHCCHPPCVTSWRLCTPCIWRACYRIPVKKIVILLIISINSGYSMI